MSSSTIVDRLERVIEAVTARSEHQLFDVLLKSFGDRPFDTPSLDTEDQALYWLPEFFVYGWAAEPVSMAYHTLLEQQLNQGQPFAWTGDKDLARFDKRMYRLAGQFPEAIVHGMTPDLAQALAELVADGLYDLAITPPVDAERMEEAA